MADHMLEMMDGTRIALRRSGRARRMILRVGRMDGKAVLTLPPGASLSDARRFADRQATWLARQREKAPGMQIAAPGVAIPVGGDAHRITPQPGLRHVRAEGDRLLVPEDRPPGPAIAAFLRMRAREVLMPRIACHVAALGQPARVFAGMQLRDTRSRWGSCSSQGRLMFSWRLAMAPPAVLDYVAAHEVAHLRHMDHSSAFWATVAQLLPDHDTHRGWLRRHGPGLMAWQFTTPPSEG